MERWMLLHQPRRRICRKLGTPTAQCFLQAYEQLGRLFVIGGRTQLDKLLYFGQDTIGIGSHFSQTLLSLSFLIRCFFRHASRLL